MVEKKKELRPVKAQRTRIEDIAAVGEVLSEEQLRLVEGGDGAGGSSLVHTKHGDHWHVRCDKDF
jgi:hypothetical protein